MKACFPIDILGNSLCPADSVRNLGVWFDSDFSLSKHVQNVCKSCFVKLCDFRHGRWFLTHDVSVLVANALVSSRLNYCNSLFRSLSKFNLRKLQCIQNSAARIVSNTSRYTSITRVLKKLHCLPVEQSIVFKTVTLVYKYLHTGIPCPPSENSLKPTCTPKHIHPSLNHSPGVLRGVRPLLCPWTQNFVDCFLFCCPLESSCLGRLSAIKVQLELELLRVFQGPLGVP